VPADDALELPRVEKVPIVELVGDASGDPALSLSCTSQAMTDNRPLLFANHGLTALATFSTSSFSASVMSSHRVNCMHSASGSRTTHSRTTRRRSSNRGSVWVPSGRPEWNSAMNRLRSAGSLSRSRRKNFSLLAFHDGGGP
jgi:hypothetical protein